MLIRGRTADDGSPSGNAEPELGAQTTGSELSTMVGCSNENVATAPAGLVASMSDWPAPRTRAVGVLYGDEPVEVPLPAAANLPLPV